MSYRLTKKLMDMYLSLTFKQEILGKAADTNDNRVEAEPRDNNHQDNNNDENRDSRGFARSAGGSQSGATVELSPTTLLLRMGECHQDTAATAKAIEESVQ